MQITTFRIAKMDCPSEEQMIRMILADQPAISSLNVDIPNRQLTVFHADGYEPILQRLDELNLDTSLVHSGSSDNHHTPTANPKQERKVLWQVLAVNAFLFVLELTTGVVSNSMGLVADSFDMLADSIVYGLALYAVGGTVQRKKSIAQSAGYLQLLLAICGFAEVLRRFVGLDEVPAFHTMILVSTLAVIGNGLCLFLLQRTKSNDAHIQASMIFTSNDVIVNIGVIIAGSLVYLTNSKYPDLVVGTVVFFIVGQGALKIVKLSR
ncbi:MAG: cation transporter [Candidatus Kapabacteria bacterium]|nr:cation transporter [Candidatus Kapabacteria bacterium]